MNLEILPVPLHRLVVLVDGVKAEVEGLLLQILLLATGRLSPCPGHLRVRHRDTQGFLTAARGAAVGAELSPTEVARKWHFK